jgi:membrane fusion protein, copper/silver efflux system
MNRPGLAGAAAAIVAAAGVIFIADVSPRLRPITGPVVSAATAADSGASIYFQDPDGKPFYSLTPKKAADGRDWRAVPASADVSFDDPEEAPTEIVGWAEQLGLGRVDQAELRRLVSM